MANPSKKRSGRTSAAPSPLDEARDELFSHILRCGVLEADPEHQKEWMDDTMQYLAERYPELTEEQVGQVRLLGVPVKLSRTPGTVRVPTPELGEHTDEILRDIGYSSADIDALRTAKVV